MAEWAWVLRESSGVIVLRNAYRDTSQLMKQLSFMKALLLMKNENGGGADHCVQQAQMTEWNSLQKLCESSPDVFRNILQMSLFRQHAKLGWDQIIK